jgi:ABC-2 type transport system permease protein
MLWYKGWLETRFRLLFTLGFTTLILVLQYSAQNAAPPPGGKSAAFGLVMVSSPILVLMVCAMLGGAGIATQPSLQATKGLHGSTLFTLSLPVSRLRLLAVRAGIGWLEAAGVIGALCCGMWLVSPAFRATTTPVEMLEYAGTLIACASAFYCLSVLLATFLDDQWRAWGTMITYVALWWLSNHTPLPSSTDIFRAMRDGSPLLAHTMPWTAMASSLGLAAILFFAALKVVQTREY